jgi:peptidylprolyl isomerase
MKAVKGSTVRIDYVAKLEDGTVFDQSVEDEPLEFVLGEGKVLPGVEEAVDGLEEGDGRTVTIPPAKGYGERDESLLRRFPKSIAMEDSDLKENMVVKLHLKDGGTAPATVVGITDSEVTVDLNHPLAGKALVFDITLVSVE